MAENQYFQLLTKASLGHMLSGKKIENAVVQLLAWKPVPADNSERYRVVLSDGIYTSQLCIITGPICSKVSNEFDRYCLLKVPRYLLNEIQNRTVIILHDLELVTKGSEVDIRLGEPVEFGKDAPDPSSFPNYKPNYHLQREDMAMEFEHCSLDDTNYEVNDPVEPESTRRDQAVAPNWDPQPRTLNQEMAIPIYALNSYSGRNWIIKGRCTSKTNKRDWKNARGEGVLFSFDLKHSKDDIRITAFNRTCTAYFDKVNVGQVYLVSGGAVYEDNKKYSKTSSKYKINLTEKSVIEPCEDESDCPPITYQFRKIDQLRMGDYPDVIAIIKSVGDVETVKKQKTQEELLKRDLTILDDSNTEIVLTLWGDTASNFVANEGDVLFASNLKVTDFSGLALSPTMSSHIEINPQNDRAFQLLGWYTRVKDSLQTKCLTEKFGTGNFPANWHNLDEIHLDNVGDRMFTSQTKAVICLIKRATFYKGCKKCSKKLEDLENARYSCQKCQKETDEFNYRLILSLDINDHTGQISVQAFHECSMKLLGEETNLEELFHLYTERGDEFEERIRSLNFLSFIFKLRSNKQMFNDLPTIRTTVVDLQPVNYVEYGNELLRKIREA